MIRPIAKVLALGVLPATCLLADFSYEQTTKITGGAMASMVKLAGAFSKQLREPVRTTVAVKGDRMVTLSPQHASIIDLSNETVTEIDFQKKQYSVMTFAEMTKMLQELSQKNNKDGASMQIKVDVKDTGVSKQVAGYDAKQVILKIIMEAQSQEDPKQKANMMVTVDSWMVPQVAGYSEIAAFQKRMAEKLNWAPGGGMMTMGRPDVAKAMAEVMKEGSKLNGMPVLQVIRMGMEGMPNQGGTAPAGEQAQQPQQQQQERNVEKPTVGGALGGALGGRLGRFGGLGRKKKQEEPQPEQQQPAQQQQQAQSAPAQPADASGALMEATSELSGFSSAAVDTAKFQVPAGFKQVQPDKRMR
jgi:hypothetical protein